MNSFILALTFALALLLNSLVMAAPQTYSVPAHETTALHFIFATNPETGNMNALLKKMESLLILLLSKCRQRLSLSSLREQEGFKCHRFLSFLSFHNSN